MKITILLLACLLLPPTVGKAGNPPFSNAETSHVRVATPGLFDGRTTLRVYLDRLPPDRYCFPLPGAKAISPYGRRGYHSGIDLKTHANDTIRCAFDGVVRMAKVYSAYGNVIVVRHPFGLETVYSHNRKNLVQSGDTVHAGTPIAIVGRTGRATTEHLHFETRINGQHFDPNYVFNMKSHTLQSVCLHCTKTGNGITVKKEERYTPSPLIPSDEKTRSLIEKGWPSLQMPPLFPFHFKPLKEIVKIDASTP